MSETMTKPNLMIPISLWGEVKVAAYRRGCKPVELVIECLREKYTESPQKERKQPKEASKSKEVVSGGSGGESEPQVKPESKECKHEWEVRNGKTVCEICGDRPKD